MKNASLPALEVARKRTEEDLAMMVIVCAMFSFGLLLLVTLVILVIDGKWIFDDVGEFFMLWAITGVLTWVLR